MTELYQVIYLSESCMPTEDGEYAQSIDRILCQSREWNLENGITGALLFSVGRFAQVLEGPRLVLKSTFGYIACDYRHKSLRMVQRGTILQRSFGGWSMAYTDGSGQSDLSLMGVTGQIEGVAGSDLLSMLRHLVAEEPVDMVMG